MQTSQIAITVPVCAILAIATLIDWRVHKVPNILTFGSAVFALILQWTVNGASGLLLGASGWMTCLACFLPFYLLGGMAAGDVKLMAAVGAFVGPFAGLAASAFSLIAGGLIAFVSVAIIFVPTAISRDKVRSGNVLRDALKRRIPYAGAIALGTSSVLLMPTIIPPALYQLGV